MRARLQPELVDSGREKFTRYAFELAIRTSDVPAASADDVRAACPMLHATWHAVRHVSCRTPRVLRCIAAPRWACDGQVRVVCISKRFSELHALHAQIGRAWEPQA